MRLDCLGDSITESTLRIINVLFGYNKVLVVRISIEESSSRAYVRMDRVQRFVELWHFQRNKPKFPILKDCFWHSPIDILSVHVLTRKLSSNIRPYPEKKSYRGPFKTEHHFGSPNSEKIMIKLNSSEFSVCFASAKSMFVHVFWDGWLTKRKVANI